MVCFTEPSEKPLWKLAGTTHYNTWQLIGGAIFQSKPFQSQSEEERKTYFTLSKAFCVFIELLI